VKQRRCGLFVNYFKKAISPLNGASASLLLSLPKRLLDFFSTLEKNGTFFQDAACRFFLL
jgi:hypothetical protein